MFNSTIFLHPHPLWLCSSWKISPRLVPLSSACDTQVPGVASCDSLWIWGGGLVGRCWRDTWISGLLRAVRGWSPLFWVVDLGFDFMCVVLGWKICWLLGMDEESWGKASMRVEQEDNFVVWSALHVWNSRVSMVIVKCWVSMLRVQVPLMQQS